MAWIISVIFSCIFIRTSLTQDSQCSIEWQHFDQCMRQQQQSILGQAGLSTPNGQEHVELDSKVRSCFNQFGCHDPIVSDQEIQARSSCFRQAANHLQSDLENCVRSRIQGFSLPDADTKAFDPWNMYLQSLNNAVRNYQNWCPPSVSQRSLRSCVESALGQFAGRRRGRRQSPNGWHSGGWRPRPSGQQRFSNPTNICDIRNQCKSRSGLTDFCESQFRQSMPQLCTCSQQLQSQGKTRNYQSEYLNCMSGQRIRINTNSDPGYKWLERGLNSFCRKSQQQQNDICANSGGGGGSGNFGGSGSNFGGSGGNFGGSGGNFGGNGGNFGGSGGFSSGDFNGNNGNNGGNWNSGGGFSTTANPLFTTSGFFFQQFTDAPDDNNNNGDWNNNNNNNFQQSTPSSQSGGGGLFGGLLNGFGNSGGGGNGGLFGGLLDTFGINNIMGVSTDQLGQGVGGLFGGRKKK